MKCPNCNSEIKYFTENIHKKEGNLSAGLRCQNCRSLLVIDNCSQNMRIFFLLSFFFVFLIFVPIIINQIFFSSSSFLGVFIIFFPMFVFIFSAIFIFSKWIKLAVKTEKSIEKNNEHSSTNDPLMQKIREDSKLLSLEFEKKKEKSSKIYKFILIFFFILSLLVYFIKSFISLIRM